MPNPQEVTYQTKLSKSLGHGEQEYLLKSTID